MRSRASVEVFNMPVHRALREYLRLVEDTEDLSTAERVAIKEAFKEGWYACEKEHKL